VAIKFGEIDNIKDTRECFIGDVFLSNKTGTKLLVFLGAKQKENSKWELNLGISRNIETADDFKNIHYEYSDDNIQYSFIFSIEVNIDKKMEFSDDFGKCFMTEYPKPLFGTATRNDFYSVDYIKVKEIKEDNVYFEITYK
jgi:hypothetical protein